MGIIACKFGGTSTAGADRFHQILDIVRADPARRIIVLSAPGVAGPSDAKVTDLLARLWRDRQAGLDPSETMAAVVARFQGIAKGLGIKGFDDDVQAELLRALEISGAHTLSRGEYLCARLFSRFSGIPMVDAAQLIHFNAKDEVCFTRTCMAFRELAREYDRVVVPGFYGSGPGGTIVTFPRNGSDITGALAAVGVGADLYENWTDVPGLMTGDPDVDPDARVIPRVTYGEMRRLAGAGARVLHPDCLAPLMHAGIPTRLKCTMRPEEPGTLIEG